MKKNKIGCAVLFAAAVNFALFCVKLYTGIATSSICIYSDSVNNLLDTLACALAFGGTLLMKKKASPELPDGYSKAEDIVGFIMAVIVGLTGVYFAYSSLERFIYPRPVNYLLKYAVVLAVAAAAKLVLGFALRAKYRKNKSVILKTVYVDSLADCGVTVMTLLSFILTDYAGLRVDAVFGLAVSAVVIFNAVKMIKSSAFSLLGKNDSELSERVAGEFQSRGIECIPVRVNKRFAAVKLSGESTGQAVREIENELGIEIFIKPEEKNEKREKAS